MLDEEEGDTLINVNIVDDEKAEKNVELKKKKPDYNPYDAGDVDEYGMVIHVFLYMVIHLLYIYIQNIGMFVAYQ